MSYPIPVLVNGKSIEYADILVAISNMPIFGATAINYEFKQDKKNIWGAGNLPISYGNGNKEATASVTIKHEELNRIRKSIPTGQILDLPPFTITVSYIDPTYPPFTHVLRNCRFMNDVVTSNQGDPSMDCQLNIVISDIEYV